jgi:predicted nucleic acid-binding protein
MLALLDACVLYPAPLRDLLVTLARDRLYRACWTHRILDEWIDNLLEARPDLTRERLERTRGLMLRAVADGLVENCEPMERRLTLPDPDDRHVLAAAIKAGADTIVTCNLRHFPPASLGPHAIRAAHPDLFLEELLARHPDRCAESVRSILQRLKHPPMTPEAYLDILRSGGLDKTAARLRTILDRA